MKTFFFLLILTADACFGQANAFEKTSKWKLYDVAGSNLFRYSVDTLSQFPFYSLNDDSIRDIFKGLKELPTDDVPVWMGAPHVATYELEGKINKIDISHYGGFFLDERTRRYYQVATVNTQIWRTYIMDCFVAIHGNK